MQDSPKRATELHLKEEQHRPEYFGQHWQHPAGQTCQVVLKAGAIEVCTRERDRREREREKSKLKAENSQFSQKGLK